MQPDIAVATVPVASLIPYAENARTHSEAQVAQIAASIAEFGFVNPEILSWHQSGAVLMMVILGGMGTLYGPMIGAFAFVLMQELFSNQAWFGAYAKHWQLAMGATIILVALYLPQGLAGLLQKFGKKKEVAEAEHE